MALITSILTGGINNHETTSEEANGIATDFVSEGVVGDITNTSGVAPATGSFAVNAQGTPDATVAISSGVAYVTGTPSTQNSQTIRVKNTASANLSISANSSGSTKYDWIYIQLDATKLNAPNTAADDVATIVASRSSSASADDGTPPTYGYPIAVVTVANGFSTITNGNIRDIRAESGLTPTPVAVSSASWTSAGATPSSIVYNGNGSYTLTWPNSIIAERSVGMRNKYTRSVTAPTQCADLESGSSQYFSRASANLTGVTFTDDFTCMGWVKLESYNFGTIISRLSATTGWALRINASGQVNLIGGASSAFDEVTSYQSVPLNKWVHIAASLDISGTTGTIYIDGVSVPVSYTNTGATAVTQGGNLEIGSANGGTFLDGKLAQPAVFSSVLSASTIRSYASQGLSGSETNLVSGFSLNGTLNDLNTSNANNLTGSGSAVATNSDSPFAGGDTLYNTDGTTEFSITTSISSDGLTEVVQVPKGYALPTSGGVSAVSYSTQKAPYGFPNELGRWTISSLHKTGGSQGSAVSGTWYNISTHKINIPVGSWVPSWSATPLVQATSTSIIRGTLSTANNTESDIEMTGSNYSNATAQIGSTITKRKFNGLTLTAATDYFLNFKQVSGTSVTIYNIESDMSSVWAEFALL